MAEANFAVLVAGRLLPATRMFSISKYVNIGKSYATKSLFVIGT
jgi:hypothetical protein